MVGFSQTTVGVGSSHAVAWTLSSATDTATTVTSSPNPSTLGATVTYTAAVSPLPDGGTIAFDQDGTPIAGCAAQPVDTTTGQATCQVTLTTPGEHTVTASYSGTATFAASTSTELTQQVASRGRRPLQPRQGEP